MVVRFPLPIDNSPKHAAALGRLIAHWGHLESQLMHLLQLLLNIDNIKARFIYQEFVSTRGKITLLKRINHFFTSDKALKDKINQLLGTAKDLNETRNHFVHAVWVNTTSQHLMRIENSLPGYTKYRKPIKKFTSQDIQNEVKKIAELSQSFQDLIIQLL